MRCNRHGLLVLDPPYVKNPVDPIEAEREIRLAETHVRIEREIKKQLEPRPSFYQRKRA
jgi:hypothetical protein